MKLRKCSTIAEERLIEHPIPTEGSFARLKFQARHVTLIKVRTRSHFQGIQNRNFKVVLEVEDVP